MIATLEGVLAVNSPTCLVVDVGGVGYRVHIPLSSYRASARAGDRVKVLTHLHVRDDGLMLYGFATESELGLFELLISVSGIGPQLAQKILSGVPVREFCRCVAAGDLKGLVRIRGIGQKLAQRLVLELRDRIGEAVPALQGDAPQAPRGAAPEEAVSALVGLGAEPARARATVDEVSRESGEALTVEQLIRLALKRI